jgi:hypothetical protein
VNLLQLNPDGVVGALISGLELHLIGRLFVRMCVRRKNEVCYF